MPCTLAEKEHHGREVGTTEGGKGDRRAPCLARYEIDEMGKKDVQGRNTLRERIKDKKKIKNYNLTSRPHVLGEIIGFPL